EPEVADLILRAVAETEGGILAFLPGEGEIRRVARELEGRLPGGVSVQTLYGALPAAAQRAAIAPLKDARKLVLSTAIAETSLTIADVRVVIDAGRARRARYDPGSGMTRLVTEPVSRAEADQRRGRAGRVAPGVCYRNWTRGTEGALPAFAPAEIEAADLAGFALDLALWGGAAGLKFLTPPSEAALAEARALLTRLGALDQTGRITRHGTALAAMPLHPRLAHMLSQGGAPAAEMAALLSERDPLSGAGADLGLRLRALKDGGGDRAIAARIRAEAKRLKRFATGSITAPEELAALAYPDRVAQRRSNAAPRYLMAGGKGARLNPDDALANAPYIVATELDGDRREAQVRTGLAISRAAIETLFADQIIQLDLCRWSSRARRVEARRQTRLGALALSDAPWPDPPEDAVRAAMVEGLRALGPGAMGWSGKSRRLRARIGVAELRDVSNAGLMDAAEAWAAPFLQGIRSADDLSRFDPGPALLAWLTWEETERLASLAPEAWQSPLGRAVPIDYSGDVPEIRLRLQEVFGTTAHPVVGRDQTPLRVVLLSPAGRPVQVTMDLPGFWSGSYAEVRKDMRARYPKHPWPEDPAAATPTLRAKPRR
ncbi:MAG: ATP-dependent helicase HrpB, partial [Pseudomonadota bacterium]